jgi:hypothetical protein
MLSPDQLGNIVAVPTNSNRSAVRFTVDHCGSPENGSARAECGIQGLQQGILAERLVKASDGTRGEHV